MTRGRSARPPLAAHDEPGTHRARAVRRILLAAATLGVVAACGARPHPPASRANPAALGADGLLAASFATPARLRYHPRERGRALADLEIAAGRRLILGEGGERWLHHELEKTLQGASAVAPEGLIGVVQAPDELWFVGASGTTYAASSWLAPFERSIVPSEPLGAVSATGLSLVGVSLERRLLRSTDFGVTWTATGPADVAFVDVALSPSGSGLALAVPEAVYRTSDHGATWHRASLPPTGALALATGRDGAVVATTVLGDRASADDRWVRAAATKPAALPRPPRGPDAAALAEGRAALHGARYVEIASSRTGPHWELWQGRLDEPLVSRVFDEGKGCQSVRIAAFAELVLFACFRARNEASVQPLELFFSDSAGKRFTRIPGELEATPQNFRFALGAGGRFVMSGVCAPSLAADGCAPSGVQHGDANAPVPGAGSRSAKRRARAFGGVAIAATPSLADNAHALAFSDDGRTAYAVGRRTKTGRYAVFVSRDAGKSFEPEDLDLVPYAADDEEDAGVTRTLAARVEAISTAEDGAVAITFSSYGRRVLVVTDERGKLLSSAEPPESRSLLGAAGLRAISITPATRQLWESLDGGVTFQPVMRLPIELCPNDSACELPVRCSPDGCVVGHSLTRIGWGGQVEDQASLLPPPLRPSRAPAQRHVRPAIACALDAAPWRVLPGVVDMPDAYDSALGGIDWYAVAADEDRAGLTLHVAEGGRVAPRVLLAPSDRPEERAFAVSNQLEGVAAIRYRTPESVPGSVNLTDVEVVWANFLEGRLGRARLEDGGPYVPNDYVKGEGRAQHADPDLVSVSTGGLYLRLHHSKRADQPTYFLDGRRVVTLPPVDWSASASLPGRHEMAHVGGSHLALKLVGPGTALVRARAEGAAYRFDAFATGLAAPTAFGLLQSSTIAYVGDRPGWHVQVDDEDGTSSRAAIFPFQPNGDAVGAPVPVPSQLALGDRAAACAPERRKTTPRVVAPRATGTRHPVLVSDTVEGPRTLLTDAAVLHGSPDTACAVAFGANALSADGTPPARERALVFLDPADRSVLFRTLGDAEATRVEYRPMTCRFDPSLEVPGEVYRALGER